ncbi:MAG: SRPBCC family protein [Planctomycetaceae bacterium]
MKYSVSIVIELPRETVVELFDNSANLPCWQRGLQSHQLVSGQAGQTGARSRLVFQMGKRRIEMLETITRRSLPDAFDGTYEAPGVFNIVCNRFISLSPSQTRWESDNEFRFSGLFMRIIGLVMRGSFPKQSQQYLQDFKAFAERGVDVRQS